LQTSAFLTLVGATAIIPYIIYFLITAAYAWKRRTLDSIPGAFSLGRWAWPVIIFVLLFSALIIVVLSVPGPFHAADKVVGYRAAVAVLWYAGALVWRLRRGQGRRLARGGASRLTGSGDTRRVAGPRHSGDAARCASGACSTSFAALSSGP